MPRIKRKNCVGQRKKHHARNKASKPVSSDLEHSYCKGETSAHMEKATDELKSVTDDNWCAAWENFFISEGGDNQQDSLFDQELSDQDGCRANTFYVVLHRVIQYEPEVDLDALVGRLQRDHRYKLFLMLQTDVEKQCNVVGKFRVLSSTIDNIKFFVPYDSVAPTIKLTLSVSSSLVPSLHVHRILVEKSNDFWTGLPHIITSIADLHKIFSRLDVRDVCVGNFDSEFVDMLPPWTAVHNTDNIPLAFREGDFGASRGDIEYKTTIRSTKCSLLTTKNRCQFCDLYRRTLRKKLFREKKKCESTFYLKKTTPIRHMSKEMMRGRIHEVLQKERSTRKELERIKRQISQKFGIEGQKLSEMDNAEFVHLINVHEEDFAQQFPDQNSLQRLLFEQQLKSARMTDTRGMRWHPMIVKWCLFIRSKSKKAYDAVRNAGFISLPSERTLFDYSHCLPASFGFDQSVVQHLKEEAGKLGMLNDHSQSFVGILQDEVKVSQGLVYDRVTGDLVGYIDLDKTGNELLNLESKMKHSKPQLASSVLVLMVRGMTTSLKYPLAAFATNGVTADLLYSIIWRAVRVLEVTCKLKVMFVTCDGASPNRKFFRLHQFDQDQDIYWTFNRFCKGRKLYFISDVPHLIKTARNCFANSGCHKKSRNLWKSGYDIRWSHIVRLYEDLVEPHVFSPLSKLTRAHIDLTPFGRMKVNLAAQIFSSSVANALEQYYGDNVKETVAFVRHMNKFFDCLNARNLKESDQKRNPYIKEYRDPNDGRLHYLTDEFLAYFDTWEQSVVQRHGELRKSERAKMMLSNQTLRGLKITVMSIVECTKFLLDQGVEFVLTHKFNQDPLEEHFSHYRHKGGANNNPTVYDVRNTLSQLRVIGSTALAPIRGNITNKRKQDLNVDHTPLMKRNK